MGQFFTEWMARTAKKLARPTVMPSRSPTRSLQAPGITLNSASESTPSEGTAPTTAPTVPIPEPDLTDLLMLLPVECREETYQTLADTDSCTTNKSEYPACILDNCTWNCDDFINQLQESVKATCSFDGLEFFKDWMAQTAQDLEGLTSKVPTSATAGHRVGLVTSLVSVAVALLTAVC